MNAAKWQRPGFISLLDEIERRGRERYGSEWPQPPTEDDIRAEGEKWFRKARDNYQPEIAPALPNGQPEDTTVDDINEKTLDEFMGPDLRTLDGDPLVRLMAYNIGQTIRRKNITTTLNDQYDRARSKLTPEIISDLRSDLYEGKVLAIYENLSVDVPIDRMYWRLHEAETVLSSGKYADFEILLEIKAPAKSTPSKNNAIVACRQWLEELRRDHPAGYPPSFRDKGDFRDAAVKRFNGLTDSGFNSAWAAAATAVPVPKTSGWGRSGRKRGEPTK